MQEINVWLQSNKDYNKGLSLYQKYGTSSFLKTIFANGPTPYNIEKLAAELTGLAPTPALSPLSTQVIPSASPPPQLKSEWLPDAQYRYLKIKEDIKTKYKQLERNMWLLASEKKESVLLLTAKQILNLNDAIQNQYALIDYYDEHEIFPDEVVYVSKTDKAQRLMVNINKAKKRLKSPNCRDRRTTEELLLKHQNELAQLRGGSNEA